MIKFFRHIRKSLLMENKTGKPALPAGRYFKYAIGEIVLVVIGILIALQINNWNEFRKEREKEKAYMVRLQDDISKDLEQLELNYDFYTQVFDFGNLALLYVEDEDAQSMTNWNLLVSFFHASQIWPIIPTTSTFEELKSSGEFSLIQNITLRNTLSFYHGGGLDRYNQTIGINPPYRKMVRGLIPTKIQNYMWNNCHVTIGDSQILKVCNPNVSEEESLNLINKFGANTKLIEELRFYMSSIKVGFATVEEQIELCRRMLFELKNELKKHD